MKFSTVFNPDFQDFLVVCNKNEVKYLLVGGYLVILNGYVRTTGDMDVWVETTPANYQRLMKAFEQFGLPSSLITLKDFLDVEQKKIFSFGIPPVCIHIMTTLKGLSFVDAYSNAKWYEIEENLKIRGLCKSDLIKAKKAFGRLKDLNDIENLKDA